MRSEDYLHKTTEGLISDLIPAKLNILYELAEEISRRNDAVPYLFEILEEDKYWDLKGMGAGWAPLHAIHLLGVIHPIEYLERFLEVIEKRTEELGDWLTEDIPSILSKFGPSARNSLKRVILKENCDLYVRISAMRALCAIAHLHSEYNDDSVKFLREIVNSDRDDKGFFEFLPFVVDALVEFRDAEAFREIKKAFDENKIYGGLIGWEDVEEIYHDKEYKLHKEIDALDNPLHYFLQDHLNYLKKVTEEEDLLYESGNDRNQYQEQRLISKKEKIGRNDPCPCGSGKKYKKCCLKRHQKKLTNFD